MSELVVTDKAGKVKDCVFVYVRLKNGVRKYQSEDTEYSVNVVVDKATAREMKKEFPQNKPKEVPTESFEESYKIPAPFPDQDDQFVFKFATGTHFEKDGEKIAKPYAWTGRPKVYLPVEGGVKDVTMNTLVANGSRGDLAFNITENSYGKSRHLLGILVKDLIELEATPQASPFGEIVQEDDDLPFEEPDVEEMLSEI